MKEARKQKDEETVDDRPIKAKALAFLKEFGIVFGAFLILNNFVIASFLVPTGSMENEVMTGDLLFVNKFIYGGTSPRNIPFTNVRLPWFRIPGFRDVERGDVTFYLKRCVALPGDTLQVIKRVLYVNGKVAPLPRNIHFSFPRMVSGSGVDDRVFPKGAQWNEDNYGPIIIPKKGMTIHLDQTTIAAWETFIVREGHGLAIKGDRIEIDGKQATEYTVQRDYLFGMGDHRDNSLDSRYWGFIPKENLVGTPLVVYWSWDTDIPIYSIFSKLASVRLGRIGTIIK
jgi:signal peptidase I